MAISTCKVPYSSHVARALEFYNRVLNTKDIYFCIGGTSVWSDENTPPVPSMSVKKVSNIIGYKLVEECYMVVPDDNLGTLSYRGVKYRIVSALSTVSLPNPDSSSSNLLPNDNVLSVVSENARWVFIRSTILDSDFSGVTYRQLGLVSGVVKNSSVSSSKIALTPAEIDTSVMPILEYIENRKPITRQQSQSERVSLLLEF